jgi:hypothetical protein
MSPCDLVSGVLATSARIAGSEPTRTVTTGSVPVAPFPVVPFPSPHDVAASASTSRDEAARAERCAMRHPRRVLPALALILAVTAPVARARAPHPAPAPPAGAMSSNVEYVTNLPEMASAVSINFIGTDMFVSTVHGVYSYDVSDPRAPKLQGALPMYIWENEDVDVDPARKLLFVSRDPRGFTSPATTAFPYGMVQVIDVSNPAVMVEKSQILLPGGHTTTCVNKCKWLWTGGPAAGPTQPGDWGGRPIFGTDLRDPAKPKQCAAPIDTGRNDGKTDYAHDVQVDASGIAWVSGRGGVRGYWTSGRHRNPLTGKVQTADGCHPIPYAGGGTDLGRSGGLMHNAWRNVRAKVDGRRGDVLYVTEENLTSNCKTSGRFAIYDLRGSRHGEGWRNIKETEFRLRELATWTPERKPGSTGCDSAHYFSQNANGVLAYAFYSQGTRFLDVSNPRKPRQIGYYRPDQANTWAAYWHAGYVYVADQVRGVDVIRLRGGARSATVRAPLLPNSSRIVFGDPAWGNVCAVRAA